MAAFTTRINAIKSILSDDAGIRLEAAIGESSNDLDKTLDRMGDDEHLPQIRFANSLAELTDDNAPMMKLVADQPDIKNLRDVARNFSSSRLTEFIKANNISIPESISGEDEEKPKKYALQLRRKLYTAEPAAVLSRMAEDDELPGMDNGLNLAVSKFLDNQPEFNIRTTSIYTALAKEDAFKDIADDQQGKVVDYVKKLSLVQALSPVPEAVPQLLKHNLTSAVRITDMPEKVFVRNYGPTLGVDVALSLHRSASAVHIRNEHALMVMRDTVRNERVMSLSGCCRGERRDSMTRLTAMLSDRLEMGIKKGIDVVPLSLENLFGDMDYCECDECLSVYSPAAYFVDLLQYLRHNNFGPDPENPDSAAENPDIKANIQNTPLGALFQRRPDLGCLELTCENTFTVLPYVDLVNEIMEYWVVNNEPKKYSFNVEDETSSELLAQPQHTNYRAYCELKKAVYPFSLPYHQAIDVARIWLNYMGTSRHELLDTFRRSYLPVGSDGCKQYYQQVTQEGCSAGLGFLEAVAQDRAVDAEYLGITQEEYIILTHEAFWPKAYFDLTQGQGKIDDKNYRENIGVRPVHEYYGYDNADKLQDLTFVKKEFLPRTGIQYTDLVELLKTRWINPQFPKGKALKILESIRFSYRFMQRLVDEDAPDPYAKLVQWLEAAPQIIAFWESFLPEDPCGRKKKTECIEKADIRQWVECYFKRLGKLIVLESGEGPYLPIEGRLSTPENENIGTLYKDGSILDPNGNLIGYVGVTIKEDEAGKTISAAGEVLTTNHESFIKKYGYAQSITGTFRYTAPLRIDIQNNNEDGPGGAIREDGFLYTGYDVEFLANWLQDAESCNLEKVRLVHLNGSPLTAEEYDRIQRFIRLWQRTGWTIDETDKALVGLAAVQDADETCTDNDCGQQQQIDFDDFSDTCALIGQNDTGGCSGAAADDFDCPEPLELDWNISPEFLHQLVALKKLADRTGLDLPKLLTFWNEISTNGEKPLYAKLFLTHNLLGVDKVFQADEHGYYLTGDAKISEHLPVLMAALRLKADEISTIMTKDCADLPDELNISTVSTLYRWSLLAKLLHVKAELLPDVIKLFGNPFASAEQMLNLLDNWTKMEDAGFSFAQLNYLLQDKDDAQHPLAPSPKTVLQLAKTLHDGLKAIDDEHPDIQEDDKEQVTAEFIRAKAGLIFAPDRVEQIVSLLEGSTVYTTNAPSGLTITIPEELAARVQYKDQPEAVPPRATLQVTGILTAEDLGEVKAASPHSGWADALERIGKQAGRVISDVLYAVLPASGEAKAVLLAGDVSVPAEQLDPSQPDPNTAPGKRLFFLSCFLPFLRRQLARRLIVETLSGAVGLSQDITEVLLADILLVGNGSAMTALEQSKGQPDADAGAWQGYLIPAVNGAYTLIALGDTQPSPITLDGQQIAFPHQQEDPNNVWSSEPVRLNGGRLYRLETSGLPATALQWKTATSPRAAIPASMLLPDYSSDGIKAVLVRLGKAALLISGFSLTLDEVTYLHGHGNDFDDFDLNNLTLQHCLRVHAYTTMRSSLSRTEISLLDLFQWASTAKPGDKPTEKVAAATGWKKEQIKGLTAANHFDFDRPEAFRNEINLIRMQKAIRIAEKVGVNMDALFRWAVPTSKFSVCHAIAQDIQNALRARYDQEDWEKVVKPLNDQLREHQKQALINYLLVQEDLQNKWQILDADSLFEYFLIDVQMSPCFETSRIKQAISSVQLFIQRCLLGLETDSDGKTIILDRDRWEWMQRYRVWEANRKVFLYPENWILSQLRDDKSPFYKELESELLQKDINQQTVEDALKSYMYKVDEVANLRVAGLYLEQEKEKDASNNEITVNIKLHIFARTRNAPYFFFYRFYDVTEGNWYPWEKVQVDIPSYDHENEKGEIDSNGTYLIPVVWQKRLLIFFPQFMKKTETQSTSSITTTTSPPDDDGKTTTNVPVTQPVEYWEIKMGWSEYRNGKWTQKQLSTEAIYDKPALTSPPAPLPNITTYEFIPRVMDENDEQGVWIDIHRDDMCGAFCFTGSQVRKAEKEKGTCDYDGTFHWSSTSFFSMQAVGTEEPHLIGDNSVLKCEDTASNGLKITIPEEYSASDPVTFYHPFAHNLLGELSSEKLDGFFKSYIDLGNSSFEDAYGASDSNYHELSRPYSLYNWEAAFHAPMLLVESLLNAQQFEQALKMCHYVFDPHEEGTGVDRFWKFAPFKELEKNAKDVLEDLFNKLQKRDKETEDQVNEWRNKPFMPHVVARSRPTAYMKWVVMKYIEILIAWGDYLFRQDTIESINQATQLYVLVSHIYGPRGYKIPKRGRVEPQTYLSLKDKWDAFSNAMTELELLFPHSNQTPFIAGASGGVAGFANIFGFASTLYFCIPDNPKIRELRATLDDRLFKIRNCQNIEGVFRKLSLFEPPIDPALLVRAAAQGLSIASVLNDLNSPMPNYRFYYLLQKAQEMCSELKALGAAYLSAKEKYDGEAVSQLRAKHESSIHTLTMELRTKQLEEAQKSLEALYQNRKGLVSRMKYYLQLIGENTDNVPKMDADFTELQNNIEQPVDVDESGLKLSPFEKEEMDKASEAHDWQLASNAVEALSAIFHALPDAVISAMPLGVGGQAKFGGSHFGNAATAASKVLQIFSSISSFQSSSAGRKGGHQRQLQERIQQANAAGYEIKNLDRQILTQQIRINIAEQEIRNQQKQIDNAQEMEDFLRSKYSNQELYQWMAGQLTTLYRQAYDLAYSLAKKAENVYRFERGLTSSNFLQGGYWEQGRDGLLSGERLSIALKQLEAAYQEKRGHDYEISNSFSLRRINPLALIELKETGRCEFALPEVLFDMYYPGQYMRRIKSVAMTVPCVVGPYTSMNCTLRLLEHQFRTSALAKDKNDYAENKEEHDERFSTVNVPISSVALSSGQNDSGVFELNFKDERYLPFEGAGAVSKWRIELPEKFRQFDYNTISDVVLHLRYTALDGGNKLQQAASDAVQQYVRDVEELSREEGLFAFFDLKSDFSTEWNRAARPAEGATERLIPLGQLNERLPYFTVAYDPKKVVASEVHLFASDELNASSVSLLQKKEEFTFSDSVAVGKMKAFAIKDVDCPLTDWTVKIADMETELDRMWMIVRYTMRE
ncbi:MAG: neuraminidase-like domain-containing protein [Candidatus Electrothrix scaldis]|nr:MAG: neuraminidase-like domain-containing protein [Candidatus Electrothrix sp. GW3-3]